MVSQAVNKLMALYIYKELFMFAGASHYCFATIPYKDCLQNHICRHHFIAPRHLPIVQSSHQQRTEI